MAVVADFICSVCQTKRHELVVWGEYGTVCAVCRTEQVKAESSAKRMTLKGLTALTVEERLARLEAELYDLPALRRRIEGLEAGQARY